MTTLADRVRFFDSVTDSFREMGFSPAQKRALKALFEAIDLQTGMTVYEPGCGAGRLTRVLARRVGRAGKVIASDPSPRMIDACRQDTRARNVEIILGAAEDVSLEPASVDCVVCLHAYPHFARKRKALRRFRTALKKGGHLLIAHFAGRAHINALHKKVNPAVAKDLLPTARVMRNDLDATGFKIERFEDEDDHYTLIARAV